LSFAQGKSLLHCLLLRGSACCFGVAICSILLCALCSVLCALCSIKCVNACGYFARLLCSGENMLWGRIYSGEENLFTQGICYFVT